ncbi:PEPxxWA-CTERM sorting domain-containing protein [Polymorphobacter fuscus]|uniref:PEPxxWA-CTERM sorting domain-containing protein n=1 Tax=Sandarakinorhabdus fusca TaxID=1439888 RepID=UPI00169B8A44|nr:PEPxxWA-CTERM sorting domain-containing protein [Polymorphobacter fuscus]NJC08362.1 hypothetical protein [Polymorphobacter fuscus]
MAAPAAAKQDFTDTAMVVTDLGGGLYGFRQGGWFQNAVVSGTFYGEDANGDGLLRYSDWEILDFSMRFTGNDNAKAFTLGFNDLFGLDYRLDGFGGFEGQSFDGAFDGAPIGGIAAGKRNQRYLTGAGMFQACGDIQLCGAVANVPEPSTWLMLIAGFGLTGAVLRRRSYRAA